MVAKTVGREFTVIPAVILQGPTKVPVSNEDDRNRNAVDFVERTTVEEQNPMRIKYAIYRITVKVLKQSWPLTRSEWRFVKDVMQVRFFKQCLIKNFVLMNKW